MLNWKLFNLKRLRIVLNYFDLEFAFRKLAELPLVSRITFRVWVKICRFWNLSIKRWLLRRTYSLVLNFYAVFLILEAWIHLLDCLQIVYRLFKIVQFFNCGLVLFWLQCFFSLVYPKRLSFIISPRFDFSDRVLNAIWWWTIFDARTHPWELRWSQKLLLWHYFSANCLQFCSTVRINRWLCVFNNFLLYHFVLLFQRNSSGFCFI